MPQRYESGEKETDNTSGPCHKHGQHPGPDGEHSAVGMEERTQEDIVRCDMCQDEVEEGDRYRLHLQEQHNVSMEDVEILFNMSLGEMVQGEMIPCDVCEEIVEDGDEYRNHLVEEHNSSFEEVEQLYD